MRLGVGQGECVAANIVRSDPAAAGIRRRRCGRGFSYLGTDAAVIKDSQTLTRIRSLVIPPAWEDVWICADPLGHIQAVGTDAAGRRQYRYHDLWREQRDRAKDFRTWHATVLAAVGLAVSESAAGREADRKRAIARVVREVADYLGNTPAVARASYIDPRVVQHYEEGRTIAAALGELGKDCDFGDLATRDHAEKAVLRLLAGSGAS
jgi:DNA topoisomerase IB